MDKRLSKFDYFVSLIIILLIVANVASFFFGVRYGADEMEKKYIAIINKDKKPDRSKDSYHQEHIVSYYHSVFQPMRDFEKDWFALYDSLSYNEIVNDIDEQLDDLQSTASQMAKRAKLTPMPQSSSYLVDAQINAIRSLELFSASISNIKKNVSTISQNELLKKIKADANYVEGRNYALLSREQYFTAIVEWNKSINRQLVGADFVKKTDNTVSQWKVMNLNLKNQMVAQLLNSSSNHTYALPPDFVGRIDEMIRNGQFESLSFKTIGEAVNALIVTKGVRYGDFALMKEKFYGTEFLPALPIYEAQ